LNPKRLLGFKAFVANRLAALAPDEPPSVWRTIYTAIYAMPKVELRKVLGLLSERHRKDLNHSERDKHP
jgi:hypothetical protein